MDNVRGSNKMAHLLLIRHAESDKNRRASFSARHNDERITRDGALAARRTGVALKRFARALSLNAKVVHCSNSARSLATAEVISNMLGLPIRSHESLNSINLGGIAGMTENEAMVEQPRFMSELSLYRAGVLNAYKLALPAGSESHKRFERRIVRKLDQILLDRDETLKIVVLHRSPITAALIQFARRHHGYPSNFYGYIELGLAHISWISNQSSGKWAIRAVNLSPDELVIGGRRLAVRNS